MLETSYQQLKMSLEQIHANDLGFDALESMVLGNQNSLSLPGDIAHNIIGRKIRFFGNVFNEKLTIIRQNSKSSLTDEVTICVKNLATLVREQLKAGNFVFEEQLTDKTIKALATSTIAEKITDKTLILKNKRNGAEKGYDSLNILSDAELKDFKTVVEGVLGEKAIDTVINQKQQNAQNENIDESLIEETPAEDKQAEIPAIVSSTQSLPKEQMEEKEAVKAAEQLMNRAAFTDVVKVDRATQKQNDTFKEEQKKKEEEAEKKAAQIQRDEIKKEALKKEIREAEIIEEEIANNEDIKSENENENVT